MDTRIWTIGHSTRSLEAFLALLDGHGIGAVADIRRFPGSRRLPWFAGEALQQSLAGVGIDYAAQSGFRMPVAETVMEHLKSAQEWGNKEGRALDSSPRCRRRTAPSSLPVSRTRPPA